MKKFLSLCLTLLLTGVLPGTLQATTYANYNLQPAVERTAAQAFLFGKDNPRRQARANKKLAAQYRPVLFNRFMKYVAYNSQSSYTEEITPGQIETAKKLYQELSQLGLDVTLSEHYYIFVKVPSNLTREVPILGFSCHYDVTPDVTTDNVHPRIITNYSGDTIQVGTDPKGNPVVLDPNTVRDAYLKTRVGKKIVTSDGSTNLGADNRAGMSIVVTMLEALAKNPSKPHGEIQVVIAPNEETGGAADYISEVPYRPDIAFDFDGNVDGELMTENFYAMQIICQVKGAEGHQSNADGTYINHGLPQADFIHQLYYNPALLTEPFQNNSIVDPKNEYGRWLRLPTYSRGKQGYVDVFIKRKANDITEVDFRLRSFNKTDLLQIHQLIMDVAKQVEQQNIMIDPMTDRIRKKLTITCPTNPSYTYDNIKDRVHPASLEVASAAFAAAGVKMRPTYERAGTTGSIFALKGVVGSYMLFTGQNNMHSYAEWLSEEDMYQAFLVGLNLIDQVAQLNTNK